MNDDIRNILLGLAASGLSAGAGWFVRTRLWRRQLRRTQAFFGLTSGAECVLVVNQAPWAGGTGVSRNDTFALLELAALIRECGARPEIVVHDTARQGIGVRTEFCVGGPVSNRRTEAHLRSLLPGVATADGPDGRLLTVGGETYRMEQGAAEYVLLARLTGPDGGRPVFLASGQRSVCNQAAVRYLARHHARLARRYRRDGTFCLLLKVVNSDAYGPDMTELVADVTAAAISGR
ncbi:hypothetical protein ACIHFE_12800 [Streptomyces sp. NPDC052396]|uniref:hypothetical protein n=1 Tax=Streptomyces sp. NPDC052396 TaxID=3365689 RepID=UPI0037D7F722